MQGLSTYLNDILVTGATIDENLKNLEAVLKKLKDAGLRLNCSKCLSCHLSFEYLGHIISEQGIQLIADKVKPIKDAPSLKNLAELHVFLELLNSYILEISPKSLISGHPTLRPSLQELEVALGPTIE